ncbi:flagellar motor protein MotB [Croceicoccus sp. F390]|uniref:Flagellar motor protein MotB n=1 Tax=Croceicoccus esteveae TaxID=3075597 RepID=A0ABU2ZE96_9SPHN|nr:flagellar motor protein MotB [Croceicoccus sp. F390]MDT0574695.1 flagellar motor protein MotB [Croceicoccus sp. F390]
MASVALLPLPPEKPEQEPQPVRPIIVKKVIVQAAGHHGGAWKVAYADFVTAMMAFFLLLWLLGATTERQKRGLSEYFTPTLVKMREQTAGSNGLLGGSSITDANSYPHAAGQTGSRSLTIPRDATGGPDAATAARQEEVTAMRRRIEERLQANKRLRPLVRQVRVMETPQGIRIDLVDDADFSMFALGTTVLTPSARELMKVIATTIVDDPAKLIVRGHTDSLPWKPGLRINNWSLSSGRAEATRQELLRDGIAERRFVRIEGVADRELLIRDNPADPRNRRISILLLK